MSKLLIPTAVLVGIGLIVWDNRLSIFDDVRLYDYTPAAAIQSLATQDTMTPYATHLFYVYHPTLEDASSFNKNCNVTTEAIVLGCTVIGRGIYLYNVTDPTLNGIEQVTAAYEMLHVGYSRLSSAEKTKIDGLVSSTYNSIAATNSLIKSEVESYYETEGASAVPNELHSVLGTEVANLPPVLEQYYSKYFKNRQTIVNMANSYESEFTQRQQIVSSDDQQLSSWQQQISTNKSNLTTQLQQINDYQSQLNSLKTSGNIAAYNSGVQTFNSLVDNYNALVDQTKSLISSYNQLVVTRNEVAVSENYLIDSISSLPSTIQTQ